MTILSPKNARRAYGRGFTLVEVLVVVAIIGMLMSLLVVGVRKAMSTAVQKATLVDISKLATAIEGVKARVGKYPPCMGAITSSATKNTSLMDRGQLFDAFV
ncbi:MAG TPA: prepilin-type N-terminal cleavage/methylation domain-containing protein [Pirellulales bacterium]|nr:prepilin-type N-terminal cleavage/methylation domain-containing protein [Pirellulales bacterium]